MQALLNDIELDVQELKCLMQSISADANPVLKIVAKRNIHQMQERLDALTKLLDAAFVITPAGQTAPDTVQNMTESDVVSEPVAEPRLKRLPFRISQLPLRRFWPNVLNRLRTYATLSA